MRYPVVCPCGASPTTSRSQRSCEASMCQIGSEGYAAAHLGNHQRCNRQLVLKHRVRSCMCMGSDAQWRCCRAQTSRMHSPGAAWTAEDRWHRHHRHRRAASAPRASQAEPRPQHQEPARCGTRHGTLCGDRATRHVIRLAALAPSSDLAPSVTAVRHCRRLTASLLAASVIGGMLWRHPLAARRRAQRHVDAEQAVLGEVLQHQVEACRRCCTGSVGRCRVSVCMSNKPGHRPRSSCTKSHRTLEQAFAVRTRWLSVERG